MKLLYILFFLCFTIYDCLSQTRLVLNNDAFIKINNNTFLVLDNSNSNAISTLGSGGNIISENEFSRIKWNIGIDTGIYIIPFTKSVGNKIPLKVSILAPGTGNGNILFSTYAGITWDNSTYLPSDVTNISSISGGLNNSSNVIDRFWIIDANNYTTKPLPEINFSYLDSEWSSVGNTMTEPFMFAQRFNNTINDWGGWLGLFGTTNVTTNTVNSGSVTPNNFYRSWTLVNQNTILPIELLYFKPKCNLNGYIDFEWHTASEKNNLHFTLEKSIDGNKWEKITDINGVGYSTDITIYNYSERPVEDYNYYRLKQTDINGVYKYSNIEYKNCIHKNKNAFNVYPNPSNGIFLIDHNLKNPTIQIVNYLGQLMYEEIISSNSTKIDLRQFSNGIYFIQFIENDTLISSQKIVKQ